MLPKHIEKCLRKIAKNVGMKNYKIEMQAGSKHGDNFLGIMIAVTLTNSDQRNGGSKPKQLHLLCKMPPLNEIRRKNFESKLVFGREICIYSKLLPAFVQFQQEKGLSAADSFLSFPKVYASEFDEENDIYFLIMEDLRLKHYQMWPKEKVMPLEFELRIMQEMGKLHAISFAMQDQQPNQFEEFKHLSDVMYDLTIAGNVKIYMDKTVDRVINLLENPEHKQFMQNFRKTYPKTIKELTHGATSKEFAVIGHGDSWNNNYLFQLDSNVSLYFQNCNL